MTKRYIDVAESAKMIRTLLKSKFPGVKFSVKSSRYAGGASIRIEWSNGPTDKQVRGFTDPFAGAGFDGMIDMQYYKTAYLLPDGTVTFGRSQGTTASRGSDPGYNEPLPEGAVEVSFGSDYVHTTRNYTEEFVRPIVEEYKKTHSDGKQVQFTQTPYGPRIDIVPWDANIRHRLDRWIAEKPEKDYGLDKKEELVGDVAVHHS